MSLKPLGQPPYCWEGRGLTSDLGLLRRPTCGLFLDPRLDLSKKHVESGAQTTMKKKNNCPLIGYPYREQGYTQKVCDQEESPSLTFPRQQHHGEADMALPNTEFVHPAPAGRAEH